MAMSVAEGEAMAEPLDAVREEQCAAEEHRERRRKQDETHGRTVSGAGESDS